MANLNPQLQRLHLHCCGQLDSSVLQYWAQLTTFQSLTRLELFAPYLVRDEAWQTFLTSKGAQLTGFLITNSPRFDEPCMLTLVEHCTKLEDLKLSELGKLKDSWLTHLHQLTLLRSLALSRPTESLTDEPVVELLGTIGARLEHLDLSGNDELTDVMLRDGIGMNCKSLQSLALSGITQLTDEGAATFFKQWKRDEGSYQNVEEMKDGMDVDLPVTNRPLSNIDLSQNPELGTDALLALLLHSGPQLVKLSINGWKSTGENALNVFAKHAPKLEELDVGWCHEVDDFVVAKLLGMGQGDEDRRSAGCVNLKVLKVHGCNRVTSACPTKVSGYLFSTCFLCSSLSIAWCSDPWR
jgi:DNA repair protein RAD7